MRPTGINNDNHFEFTPDLRMERSTFNRKFRTLTTFNAGQLIPVFLDQSITYGDTVSMDLSNITRLITPLNPTMDNARIDFYAYQVPIRQIWKHFKEFQGENTVGAWTETREFAKPQLRIKWLKYFNGAFPVNVEIHANPNGAYEWTFNGAGAGLRQAILKAIETRSDTQANDYAKANLLTGYYQPFSLMDYFGIPDVTANIKPHTLDWNKGGDRIFDRVAITSVGTRNEITAIIGIDGRTLQEYGYEGGENPPTVEMLVKSINNILNAFGTLYEDTDGTHPIIEIEVSALPFRAYQYVYDNAFRNQNYIAPVPIETYNGDETMTNGEEFYRGGNPAKVNRASDYFSTCLPEPQKGNAILTPLGTSAPVIGNAKAIGFDNGGGEFGLFAGTSNVTGLGNVGTLRMNTGAYDKPLGTQMTSSNLGTAPAPGYVVGLTLDGAKSGMVADLTQAVAATVNAQRLAFAVQHVLERDARGGTLYQDQALSHFGVRIPSLIAQVPEYLGGESIPISITQVNQTSATSSTPLGETGANSVTGFSKRVFTKSFLEPCILMVLAAVRTDRTYGQGIHRDWFKKYRLDDYYPELAHLGEQAVYNREIYATGTPTDTEVWGYQERWVELRTGWSNTTGAMRVTYAESLDVWHYGDKYESMPVLSKDWLQEDTARVDRTLVYSAETTQQFISDWLFECRYTRIMPIYSIPSLIDHY